LPWRFAMQLAKTRSSTRTDLAPHTPKSPWLILSFIALILGFYSYPALKTAAKTGSRDLPAVSAPDMSLYLNISSMKATSSGTLIDPYYGIPVPSARLGYLKFRTAFLLFEIFSRSLHGNLWWSLLLWNLFWWGLLCALVGWFFQQFLPEPSLLLILLGIGLLMFFNFGVLKSVLGAWAHLPSLHSFDSVEFPFIRPFFPQVPIPLLVFYIGLQIKALQKPSTWIWVAMIAVQFSAFTIFPYAMLMMAGVTAVVALGQLFVDRTPVHWYVFLFYAVACAISDLLFFLHGGEAGRSGAPGQYSLIRIQLSLLPHRIGGMWLILGALTLGMFLLRDLSPQIKLPLVGLGMSNLFLLLGDAFFSETAVQMSTHGGYFVQLSATVLFIFLLSAWTPRFDRNQAWRFALVALILLLTLNGALVADATYRAFLPMNEEQAAIARLLQSDPPEASDLVIARAQGVDDDCAWVPLLSSSHVLFCRNAQVLLSPEQNRSIQRLRQAFYLNFTNKDVASVEHVLADPNAGTELNRLMFLGQEAAASGDRNQGIAEIRADLLPLLTKIQNQDIEVRSFFTHYRRVLVLDDLNASSFAASRLTNYLKIEKQQSEGRWLRMDCRPR
jgi:hypothetical protein